MRQNSDTFLYLLLGSLTAFGPLVTDMYLPALPAMTECFHTSMPMVQLGLTFSMIGLAAGQLLFGPLSDKYGRRPLLLVSMAVFILSTIGCIFSPTIHWFVALRLLQGIGASGGIVISRSVATDKFSGRELAKAMAIIGAINGIAPVAAPVAGGFFTDIIGWQGIFIILLCIGFILLAAEVAYRETLPAARRSDDGLKRLALNFGKVLGNKKFLFYVLQFGCASGVLFGNIASSPPRRLSCSSTMASLRLSSVRFLPSIQSLSELPRRCRSSSVAQRAPRFTGVCLWWRSLPLNLRHSHCRRRSGYTRRCCLPYSSRLG